MANCKFWAGLVVAAGAAMQAETLQGALLQRLTGAIDLAASQSEESASVTRALGGWGSGTANISAPASEFDPESGAAMTVAYDFSARGSQARISLDVSGDVWLPWSSVAGNVQLAFRTSRALYYQFTVDLASISNYQIVRLDDVEASLWYDGEHVFGGTLAPLPPDFAPTTHFSVEGLLAPGRHTLTASGQPFIDRSTPVALAFSAEVDMRPATRAEQRRLVDGPVMLAIPAELRAQAAPEPATLVLVLAGASVLPAIQRLRRR